MNKPSLQFPEFKEAWIEKGLGSLLEFKNGINASKEQYGRGVKFINVLDILNNEFITQDKIIGSVDVEQGIADKYPVNYGDILFQRSSETREEVGSASVYLDKENTATFGGFVIRGRKIGEYDPVFLNKLLKTDASRDAITSKSGGSTRYNVGQETLTSIKLHFPSLPEQTKIASFLSVVDEKLQALKKKINLLEEYKKGVMQKIFSQELRFMWENGKEFSDWEEMNLGDILTIGNGKDYKHLGVGDIPVFGTGGYMTSVDSFLYDGETVCIGRKGTIDKPMYFHGKIWTVDTLFFTHSFVDSFPKFIFYVFQTINWKEYNEASGVPSLSKSTLEKIGLKMPSLSEQIHIASFLSTLDEKINHSQSQIEKTETWKKGLLQKMFV